MHAARARRPDPDGNDGRSEGLLGRMSLLEHLEEFRVRLIRAVMAVGAGMVVSFFFVGQIVDFIFAPTRAVLPPGAVLIYTQPGEAFGLMINVALLSGAILASPLVFYQVWRFIAPALHARERRFLIPFVFLTTTGTVAGAAFSHYILFPYMIAFFGSFSSGDLEFMPQVSEAFGLYLKMLLGMVLIFQMPTFAFFLAKMGMVTARWLWRHIKYAILLIFIIAAVLTPSADPWNQTVFAAPMIGLYFICIAIAWIFGPKGKEA